MSSSSEPSAGGTRVQALALPELRSGRYTRLGGSNVLGDQVTEHMLGGLAAGARDAARAEGYSVGWTEGRRAADELASAEARERAVLHADAEARRDAEHRAAVAALADAAAQVRALLEAMARDLESQAAGLAWALTAEVVGARLAEATPADVVAKVLDVLPAAAVGRVRVHPALLDHDDVEVLRGRGLLVVADAGLGLHDAVVETDDGAVTDLRVEAAMERVREVLA